MMNTEERARLRGEAARLVDLLTLEEDERTLLNALISQAQRMDLAYQRISEVLAILSR